MDRYSLLSVMWKNVMEHNIILIIMIKDLEGWIILARYNNIIIVNYFRVRGRARG